MLEVENMQQIHNIEFKCEVSDKIDYNMQVIQKEGEEGGLEEEPQQPKRYYAWLSFE